MANKKKFREFYDSINSKNDWVFFIIIILIALVGIICFTEFLLGIEICNPCVDDTWKYAPTVWAILLSLLSTFSFFVLLLTLFLPKTIFSNTIKKGLKIIPQNIRDKYNPGKLSNIKPDFKKIKKYFGTKSFIHEQYCEKIVSLNLDLDDEEKTKETKKIKQSLKNGLLKTRRHFFKAYFYVFLCAIFLYGVLLSKTIIEYKDKDRGFIDPRIEEIRTIYIKKGNVFIDNSMFTDIIKISHPNKELMAMIDSIKISKKVPSPDSIFIEKRMDIIFMKYSFLNSISDTLKVLDPLHNGIFCALKVLDPFYNGIFGNLRGSNSFHDDIFDTLKVLLPIEKYRLDKFTLNNIFGIPVEFNNERNMICLTADANSIQRDEKKNIITITDKMKDVITVAIKPEQYDYREVYGEEKRIKFYLNEQNSLIFKKHIKKTGEIRENIKNSNTITFNKSILEPIVFKKHIFKIQESRVEFGRYKDWHSFFVNLLSMLSNVFLLMFFGLLTAKTAIFKNDINDENYLLLKLISIAILILICMIDFSITFFIWAPALHFAIETIIAIISVIAVFGIWGTLNNSYTDFGGFFKAFVFIYAAFQIFAVFIGNTNSTTNVAEVISIIMLYVVFVGKIFIILKILHLVANKRLSWFFLHEANEKRTTSYEEFVKLFESENEFVKLFKDENGKEYKIEIQQQ